MTSANSSNNIKSNSILDNTLEYCIALYIEEGETRDGLLNKFSGNKIELVNWLRARAFKKGTLLRDIKPSKELPSTEAVSSETPAVTASAKTTTTIAKKKRSSKTKDDTDKNNNQNQFF